MRYLIDLDPNHAFFGCVAKWIHGIENITLSNALTIIMWALCIILPYLLGSLNSAIIISRYKFKQDIRSFGSGNAGLTNMHRVYGKDGAIWTLFGDIAKQLKERENGDAVLICESTLRYEHDKFIDDTTPEWVEHELGVPVLMVPNDGYKLLCAMLGEDADDECDVIYG